MADTPAEKPSDAQPGQSSPTPTGTQPSQPSPTPTAGTPAGQSPNGGTPAAQSPAGPGAFNFDRTLWWDGVEWRKTDDRFGLFSSFYGVIVWTLVVLILVVIVSAVVATFVGKSVQDDLVTIAASATTGLIGLLAPSPLTRQTGSSAPTPGGQRGTTSVSGPSPSGSGSSTGQQTSPRGAAQPSGHGAAGDSKK